MKKRKWSVLWKWNFLKINSEPQCNSSYSLSAWSAIINGCQPYLSIYSQLLFHPWLKMYIIKRDRCFWIFFWTFSPHVPNTTEEEERASMNACFAVICFLIYAVYMFLLLLSPIRGNTTKTSRTSARTATVPTQTRPLYRSTCQPMPWKTLKPTAAVCVAAPTHQWVNICMPLLG